MSAAQIEDRVDDLDLLLSLLPIALSTALKASTQLPELAEIILDIGRVPEVRYKNEVKRLYYLNEITQDDIHYMVQRIGSFNTDNRAGIERTLHRISAIRNRENKILGLTCRVGRAVEGTIEVIRDLLQSGKNVLFVGPPGIGKTTKLREASRVLADELMKRVVIVDTSNEIAGDGDIPHSSIGYARRMQVPSPDKQHMVMIEAVENHMPEVIIVDEIGSEEEAAAARTIAERGVQLIATAHGHTMENLIKNPTLCDLLGGLQSVILGDEEAKFRGTQKTVLERKSHPTFDILIEIREQDMFAIYPDIKSSVDAYLRGYDLEPEIRRRTDDGDHDIQPSLDFDTDAALATTSAIEKKTPPFNSDQDHLSVYPFGINTSYLYSIIESLGIPVEVSQGISDADILLTTRSTMRSKSKTKINQLISTHSLPLHVVKDNTREALVHFFQDYYDLGVDQENIEEEAIKEIERICRQVTSEKIVIEASARDSYLRRLQHQFVEEQRLNSLSVGEEPNRRVRVYPS